jgi:hypothetical protein
MSPAALPIFAVALICGIGAFVFFLFALNIERRRWGPPKLTQIKGGLTHDT